MLSRIQMKTLSTRFLAITLIAVLGCFASLATAQTTDSKQDTKETKPDVQSDEKTADQKGETTKKDEKTPDPFEFKVADDNIQFTASGTWKNVPPKSRMLEVELKIPRVGADTEDGRLTIMGAGGSIEANILRWQNQFKQPDGSSTAAQTKTEKKKIAGQTVNMVDITGTFIDSPGGPFSGQAKVERKGYRMLAAIIQTEAKGNYFVKLYGPKPTIDKKAEHFKSMIQSLKVSD